MNQQKKEIVIKYNLLEKQAKTERNIKIERARAEFKSSQAQRRLNKTEELKKISTQRKSLDEVAGKKKKLQINLAPVHKSLGIQLFELESLVNAAFPQPEDKEIRKAILRGDTAEVERLLKTRK